MYNGHLSIEEIEQFIQQKGPAEYQSHVESCQQCRSLLEDCQAFNAKLDKLVSVHIGAGNAMNCPDGRVWFDVAAGTLPDSESLRYVQHAAECSACGEKLKAATRIFDEELSPEENKILASLPDNPAMQQKVAQALTISKIENLQKQDPITDKRFGFLSWRSFSWVAATVVAAAIAFSSLVLYRQYELHEAEQAVAEAYKRGRPMEYKVAGMPYGPVHQELGDSSVLPSLEIPKSEKVPVLAAQAAFLERDSTSAISILEKARRSGNNSISVLDNLVVAYAMEGDRTGAKTDYERALQLSEEIIRLDVSKSDSTVYFNRILIFERRGGAGDSAKAAEALAQYLQLERDPDWLAVAKKKVP